MIFCWGSKFLLVGSQTELDLDVNRADLLVAEAEASLDQRVTLVPRAVRIVAAQLVQLDPRLADELLGDCRLEVDWFGPEEKQERHLFLAQLKRVVPCDQIGQLLLRPEHLSMWNLLSDVERVDFLLLGVDDWTGVRVERAVEKGDAEGQIVRGDGAQVELGSERRDINEAEPLYID